MFLFLKIYDRVWIKHMFQNSVLSCGLMSPELIKFLNCSNISLILFEIWHQMERKSWKRKNALLEKISKSFFNFFLLRLPCDPLLSFYSKNKDKCALHIFFYVKKRFIAVNIPKNTGFVLETTKQHYTVDHLARARPRGPTPGSMKNGANSVTQWELQDTWTSTFWTHIKVTYGY